MGPVLLMVDDDEEDIYLTRRAFCAQREDLIFSSVQNNEDLFDYLYCRRKFAHISSDHLPDIILLDINIPKVDGYEILKNIRSDAEFRHVPVVMLSTSIASSDIRKAYRLGANSFITKSVSVSEMQKIAELFCRYWFSLNHHPRAFTH